MMTIFYMTKLLRWRKALKIGALLSIQAVLAQGQSTKPDSLLTEATLENVVRYAIRYQPLIQQSVIDEEVTQATIKGKLADWYPQLNFLYSYQRNIQLQTSIIGGNPIKFWAKKKSAPQLLLTLKNFYPADLLGSNTPPDARTHAK